MDVLVDKPGLGQLPRPLPNSLPWRTRSIDHRRPDFEFAEFRLNSGELALLATAILICLRCGLAATLPLSFDEAYYWLWSKHLAGGYFEHPAAIAFVIRAGTFAFGDTEFGVRFIPLVISVVASWAVWRTATIILGGKTAGAIAVLLFNCTLMISAEGMAATPDSPLVAAAALLLWSVAELERTQNGRWWLAAGGAMGSAIAAKYTGFFLCGSVAIWLAIRAAAGPRAGTNWLRTLWPYAGAAIVLTMFAPTLYWNATHAFISFRFQFGRVVAGHISVLHLLEFIGGQMALASPGVFALSGIGFYSSVRSPRSPSLSFVLAVVSLPLLYFILHSLHDRVQANWPCFVYPALAVLAAKAFTDFPPEGAHPGPTRLICRSAIPLGCLILAVAYVQAFFGAIPLGHSDPISRMAGVGFQPVADRIAAEARKIGAHAIVTTNYPATSWLRFYGRSTVPVIQIADDSRFLSSPTATQDILEDNLLYVTQHERSELPLVLTHFSRVTHLAAFVRSRNGIPIDTFDTFAIGSIRGPVTGRIP
ncbi:MAG TPA: glycosyltransferase family 39 protein [Rhizomicrobium sp.]|nr:glycosyltransferase family 39 protein [Rhizomicrobium sp.]